MARMTDHDDDQGYDCGDGHDDDYDNEEEDGSQDVGPAGACLGG